MCLKPHLRLKKMTGPLNNDPMPISPSYSPNTHIHSDFLYC